MTLGASSRLHKSPGISTDQKKELFEDRMETFLSQMGLIKRARFFFAAADWLCVASVVMLIACGSWAIGHLPESSKVPPPQQIEVNCITAATPGQLTSPAVGPNLKIRTAPKIR